jgi:hypothetical protein
MSTLPAARTYNQEHTPRKYTPGKRRLSIYWTWSYPWESQRDPAAMENRFSTITEVRTVLWPNYETPEYSAAQFLQGIAGTGQRNIAAALVVASQSFDDPKVVVMVTVVAIVGLITLMPLSRALAKRSLAPPR